MHAGSTTGGSATSGNLIEKPRHDSVGSSTSTSGGDEPSVAGTLKRASIKRNFIQLFGSHKLSERVLRESNVLLNDDGKTWDWDVILAILRVCFFFVFSVIFV